MPAPVTVSVDVPLPREQVYDFLDVLPNHEGFTDHVLTDWQCSGPDRGVGAKARVTVKSGPMTDDVEFEVIEAEPPRMIRERNVGAKGKRIAYGTYELSDLPDGGTHVQFTYSWETLPLSERLLAPLVRSTLRKANARAMARLAETLS
jgi:carbon monoxide dehydrogenase subunit G